MLFCISPKAIDVAYFLVVVQIFRAPSDLLPKGLFPFPLFLETFMFALGFYIDTYLFAWWWHKLVIYLNLGSNWFLDSSLMTGDAANKVIIVSFSL